jgi:hypothetical protein
LAEKRHFGRRATNCPFYGKRAGRRVSRAIVTVG